MWLNCSSYRTVSAEGFFCIGGGTDPLLRDGFSIAVVTLLAITLLVLTIDLSVKLYRLHSRAVPPVIEDGIMEEIPLRFVCCARRRTSSIESLHPDDERIQ